MMVAKKIGRPIDPDILWERFASEIQKPNDDSGAISASILLDMARAFNIARHLDITHDVDRAGQALSTQDVAGVLMTFERFPNTQGSPAFEPLSHMVVVHRVLVDPQQRRYIEVESAHEDDSSEIARFPESSLAQLMGAFLILYGLPITTTNDTLE
jgi:hypothetical protein